VALGGRCAAAFHAPGEDAAVSAECHYSLVHKKSVKSGSVRVGWGAFPFKVLNMTALFIIGLVIVALWLAKVMLKEN
jgi:hypothetical protein